MIYGLFAVIIAITIAIITVVAWIESFRDNK
jgi:hypothetical protein